MLDDGLPQDVAVLLAQAKAEARRAKAAAGVAPTVEEYAPWWFDQRYVRGDLGRMPGADSTLRHVGGHVRELVAYWKDTRLNEITFEQCKAFMVRRHGIAATKNRVLNTMQSMLTDAVLYGKDGWRLDDNPSLRIAHQSEAPYHRPQLELDEVIAVLDRLVEQRAKGRRALAFALLCGLRLNEAIRLTTSRLLLGPEYEPCAGAIWFEAHQRKDRKAIAVPMPKLMLRYLPVPLPWGLLCDVHEDTCRTDLRRALRSLGIERDVTPHGLRGTWASSAAALGLPMQLVGQILGHSSSATTSRYYVRIPDRPSRAMMENVSRAFEVAAGVPLNGAAQ